MGPAWWISVGVLCLVGFWDALFFTLVQYRVVPPDPRWLPRVCRMEEGRCFTILQAREARLLGIPNSVLGLFFYPLVFASALWGFRGDRGWLWVAVGSAASATLVSAYLAWALLVRLRTHCVLCYLAHTVNFLLLVLLVAAA
jgi:uncharacterized membrane protein